MKEQIFKHIEDIYNVLPEYPWAKYDSSAVFRHKENRKWFALIMDVRPSKLGLGGEEDMCDDIGGDASFDTLDSRDSFSGFDNISEFKYFTGFAARRPDERHSRDRVIDDDPVPVMNLKIDDPVYRDILTSEAGIFPAYHMNKDHWITVLLDGTVPFEEVTALLEVSYQATSYLKARHKDRAPKEWIIPSNPKYYDVEHAFDEADEIDWKQGRGINTGDIVYLYVGSPVSAIRYRCKVIKTDIPYDFDNGKLQIRSLMTIRLLRRYEPEEFSFERLKDEFGIYAIRGPRGIPNSLSRALDP